MNTTIVAVATAHGIGSISIVRLSGKEALYLAKKITKKENFSPRYATLSYIYDTNNNLIDQALVIYFQAPKSFTGEDVVEFQCHGGIMVASLVVETLLEHGARLAENGEFSKRAFLNGKIDLTKVEAIAKLIESKSEDSVKLLARQMRGELQGFVENLRTKLIEILAFVEVNIDYAEEDLPLDLLQSIENKLEEIQTALHVSYESSKRREGLLSGFYIAIIGKPNVGKSSLLNALLNYERAITSDIAGTTRDVIEEEIKLGTHLVKIVDTAGIRSTEDIIEKIGVTKAKNAIKEANIIIAMFDISSQKDEQDRAIEALVEDIKKEKKVFIVFNKIDKNPLYSPIPKDSIQVSCKKTPKIIIEELIRYLDTQSVDDCVMFTSKRQLQAVKKAQEAIEESKILLHEGTLELFAFHLHTAIENISSITKPYAQDEMLDAMFSSFCLGK